MKIIISNQDLDHTVKYRDHKDQKITLISSEEKNINSFLKTNSITKPVELFLNVHGKPSDDNKTKLMLNLNSNQEIALDKDSILPLKGSGFSDFLNKFFHNTNNLNIIHVNSCFAALAHNEIKNLKGDYVILTYIGGDRSISASLMSQSWQGVAKSNSFGDYLSKTFHNNCATQSKISFKLDKKIYEYDFYIPKQSFDNKDCLTKSLQEQYSEFKKFYNNIMELHSNTYPDLFEKNQLEKVLKVDDSILNQTANSTLLRITTSPEPFRELNNNLFSYDANDYLNILSSLSFDTSLKISGEDKEFFIKNMFEVKSNDYWKSDEINPKIIKEFIDRLSKHTFVIHPQTVLDIINKTGYTPDEEDLINLLSSHSDNEYTSYINSLISNNEVLTGKKLLDTITLHQNFLESSFENNDDTADLVGLLE
jgi:hypothetical protein